MGIRGNIKMIDESIRKKKIVLQNICEKYKENYINEYRGLFNFESFGRGISKLFNFQVEALYNALTTIKFYHKQENNINKLFREYSLNTFYDNIDKPVGFTKDEFGENFEIFEDYFDVEDGKIEFKNLCNRAGFWMATGSGKTIVMIKLIELLNFLMEKNEIPKNDILILAPKDKILNQIKNHVEDFNSNGDKRINLLELTEWKRQSQINNVLVNDINVYYYRSDLLKSEGIDTEKETNYLNYLNATDEKDRNCGGWYVLLDEAHKGETGKSIGQNIISILSKEGFLFNFSATLVDLIDRVTTAFYYGLDKFIQDGYGKKIYVSGATYESYRERDQEEKTEDEIENEKRGVILKSLLFFAVIKKSKKMLDNISDSLYHNPLMVTVGHKIMTEKAVLKIYFGELLKIATDDIELSDIKQNLIDELNINKTYEFSMGSISEFFVDKLNNLTIEDLREALFNTPNAGSIECIEVADDDSELLFKMTQESVEPFCLLKASKATKWADDFLEGYEKGETLEKSFFESINNTNSKINLLMGRNIFAEGWDSNRPNIINFINLGVGRAQKYQKYIRQTTGRGVRIQPFKDYRKRLNEISNYFEDSFGIEVDRDLLDKVEPLESLFIFTTKRENTKDIIDGIYSTDLDGYIFREIEEYKVNDDLKNNNILVPKYQDDFKNENPHKYKISSEDFDLIKDYLENISHKVLMVSKDINLKTLKKIFKPNNYFDTDSIEPIGLKPEVYLKKIQNHFEQNPKKFEKFRPIRDNDIVHYKNMSVNIPIEKLNILNDKIKEELKEPVHDEQYLMTEIKQNAGSLDQIADLIKDRKKYKELRIEKIQDSNINEIDLAIFKTHYYNPLILRKFRDNNKINEDIIFKNILNVKSEVEFIKDLSNYHNNENCLLYEYDWWYFSKLVEQKDEIFIPYYDEKLQSFKKFYPDFIFWMKKNDKYFVKFIDPKGNVMGEQETAFKTEGFQSIFSGNLSDNEIDICVDLHFYNYEGEVRDPLKNYFTKNFDTIFK